MSLPDTDHPLRADWEARAAGQGAALSGVLLRNLSPQLNQYLHDWHWQLVQNQLLSHMPHGARVMDVACGYGRVSQPLTQFRPDIQLLGLDFAYTYCQLYSSHIHSPAVCASITDLPLAYQFLDGIIAITAMMYVPDGQEEAVLRHLVQRLKPGGYILLVDPGSEYLSLITQLRGTRTSTSGKAFKQAFYLSLGQYKDTKLVAAGGIPLFSLLLPFLHVVSKKDALVSKFLPVIKWLDARLGNLNRFTLHRWMLLQRMRSDQP